MILVSACLLGHNVRYDGGANPQEALMDAASKGRFLPVCPECAGGLSVPREPVEIRGGTGEEVLRGHAVVADRFGIERTKEFLRGAQAVLNELRMHPVRVAILKESSPSCGVHTIYDGSFSHTKTEGQGVCAALLRRNGIRLYSEKDITQELLKKLLAEDIREN